jgi:hypothetical protein
MVFAMLAHMGVFLMTLCLVGEPDLMLSAFNLYFLPFPVTRQLFLLSVAVKHPVIEHRCNLREGILEKSACLL